MTLTPEKSRTWCHVRLFCTLSCSLPPAVVMRIGGGRQAAGLGLHDLHGVVTCHVTNAFDQIIARQDTAVEVLAVDHGVVN